jgi:hypothetical protein
MSSPLKAGDLCWIAGFVSHDANVGRNCELVVFVLPGQVFEDPTQRGEYLRLSGEFPAWLVTGDTLVNKAGDAGWCLVRREHLRRLDGPAVDVTTPAVLEVPA